MYKTVFISHSKDDSNLDLFQKVFAALPIESIWMEFENISPPPYTSIIKNVNRIDALFLLLSEHLLDKQHTNNWVSFEVGLAANREKVPEKSSGNISLYGLDIYVFEPIDQHIAFTVPYFTHFMRYPKDNRFVTWIIDKMRKEELSNAGFPIKCKWENCKISFNYMSRYYTDSYYCPACGGEIIFKKGYEDISPGSLEEFVL